jgi:hypothetical protein
MVLPVQIVVPLVERNIWKCCSTVDIGWTIGYKYWIETQVVVNIVLYFAINVFDDVRH